jgi:cytochrome P450
MGAFAEGITLEQMEEDPHPIYRRLRREEPVAWVPVLKAWLVTRWDDVRRVLGSPESFVTDSATAPLVRVCGASNMLSTEGDRHAEWRQAVDDTFAREAALLVAAQARSIAEACVRPLLDRPGADLMGSYFEPVGATTVARVLGLDRFVGTDVVMGWCTGITDGLGNPTGDPERNKRAAAAGADMEARLLPVVTGLTDHPDDSLISHLIHAGRPAGDPRPPADILAQLKAMTLSLRQPGWISGNTLHALLTHPDQLGAVRANPRLLPDAVHEGIRWAPAVSVLDRWATRPVTLNGHQVPAGAMMAAGIASANRDESSFRGRSIGTDPNAFDITRPRRPYLSLGYARHQCLMTPFIPHVVEAALGVLLDTFPELRLDGPPPKPHGWKFRRLDSLPVRWDAPTTA